MERLTKREISSFEINFQRIQGNIQMCQIVKQFHMVARMGCHFKIRNNYSICQTKLSSDCPSTLSESFQEWQCYDHFPEIN